MKKQIAAAVTALALTLGGLALAAPASADDAIPTQEVASSQPDTATTPSLVDTATTPSSPTSPSDTPAEESGTPTPADTPATPEVASPAVATPPTEESAPLSESSPTPSSSSARPAPEAAGDEWFSWLMPVTSLPANQQGHVGAIAAWFDQQPLGLGQIAPQPGTCVQQDHYQGPRHKLDALYAAPLTWNAAAGHASDNDIPGVKVVDWTIICQPVPPVTQECTSDTSGATSTNLDAAGWVAIDQRSAGHAEYVPGGLHVYTDDNSSNAKVQWAVPASFALSNTGTFAVNWAGTSPAPGINLFVNFGADGSGTLVYEGVYGQDLWLTNGSSAAVKANAPVNGGGNGSQWHGTIDQWLAKYPDAQVTGVGFSLGSGVLGDGILHSISTGCGSWAFDYQTPPPVVVNDAAAAVVVSEPTCDTDGVPSVSGVEHATLANKLDETPGDHVAVFTADEGHAFAEGAATLDVPYTVKAKTGNCPVTTPTPTPTPTQSTTPTETATPIAAVVTDDSSLAETGSDVEGAIAAGIIVALGMLAAGTVLTVQAIRRRRAEKVGD